MTEGFIVGAGMSQRVDPTHRVHDPEAVEREVAYHLKSRTHLWVVATAYMVSAEALAADDGVPLDLDTENLITHGVGCFICEVPFERAQIHRACRGPA